MNINELIKQSHEAAIEKGFYDCRECNKGAGQFYIDNGKSDMEQHDTIKCTSCNGTGKADRNIGELLMLIVSELGEALEAHRTQTFANCDIEVWTDFDSDQFPRWFEKHVKDSFEDEIADVFIRLFDFAGYRKFGINKILEKYNEICEFDFDGNVGEILFNFICYDLSRLNSSVVGRNEHAEYIGESFAYLKMFCDHRNIDIEKHITAKMAYNKTREYKHGKEY